MLAPSFDTYRVLLPLTLKKNIPASVQPTDHRPNHFSKKQIKNRFFFILFQNGKDFALFCYSN